MFLCVCVCVCVSVCAYVGVKFAHYISQKLTKDHILYHPRKRKPPQKHLS